MRGILSLAAIVAACHAAAASASGAPVVDGEIETAIKTLDVRVETETLAKLQDLVERDVVGVTHGLLRREARRVLAMTAPGAITLNVAPFES